VSLSGFFGDEVVTNPGRHYFMDLPAEGRILEFMKVCLQKGKYGLPFKQLLKASIPAPLLDRWRKTHYRPPARQSLLSDRGIDLRLERSVEGSGRVTSGHKQHLLKLASGMYSQRRLQSEALYGIMHRIEPRYPLADIRLITFFLSLPSSVIGHPHTERYLYRKSMGGIVPDEILWRTDKNIPAGVFYLEENRKMAGDIRKWLSDIRNQRKGRLLNALDFEKIDQRLDPDHQGNQWNGRFYPNLSFSLQSLIRYLTMHEHA
jgi:asparagine synthase (glutamine-hydrolysing)